MVSFGASFDDLLQTVDDDVRSNPESISKPSDFTKSTPRIDGQRLDLERYLSDHGIAVRKVKANGKGMLHILKQCLFDASHTGKDAAICQAESGMLTYQCFHDSCRGRKWVDARALISGSAPLGKWITGTTKASHDFQCADDHWPDPEPIPTTLKPVEPFDFALLPPMLRGWVNDISDRMQCPPDYPAVGAMVMTGSLIGRKVGIHPKQHDDWLVIPNLWGNLIGRPSELKSPSLKEITKPLRRLEVDAKEFFEESQKEFHAAQQHHKIVLEAAQAAAKKAHKGGKPSEDIIQIFRNAEAAEVEPPKRKRYIINDATVEKLGEILNESPNGIMLFRDELAGWMQTINREDRTNDRTFYLEAWDGTGRYTYDRIGRGTIDIESVCVSVLGGIQPGRLMPIARGAIKGGIDDDGLMQRFQLAVYPDRKGWKIVDRWPDKDAKETAYRFLKTIACMTTPASEEAIPALRFSPEAQTLFYEWLTDLETEIRGDDIHPALESHLAKYRSLIPSLALICHLAERQEINLDDPVGVHAMEMALAWYEYLRSHAERIYGLVVDNHNLGAAAILSKIKQGKLGNPFKRRDIVRASWTGLTEPDDIDGALDVLVDLSIIKPMDAIPGAAGGRPTKSYAVNPKIFVKQGG